MSETLTLMRIDEMRSAARRIVRDLGFMQRGLAGTGLSPSVVHTILELGYGTVTTAGALGALLRLEKSTVSRMVHKMERDGLLTVAADPADKRVRLLALTPKGRGLLSDIEDFARLQLRAALEPLPGDDIARIEAGLGLFANALGAAHAPVGAAAAGVDLREGYRPGVIASVVHLHASYYAAHYGFGAVFERKVATEMSEFMGRIDRPQNTVLSAYQGDALLGSVSLDGEGLGAGEGHLRWFIVSPSARGMGIGGMLLERATGFADRAGYGRTRLWTFEGLDAARHLYERHGFALAHAAPGRQWGTEVIEQEFVRKLGSPKA